jgi:transcriptional regulator with XRE-family HTH domain
MRDLELGRVVRNLRRRLGWRQADCGDRARVHRSTWSNLERGRLEQMSLRTLRACLAVVEVQLELEPRWRGSQMDRLRDEGHATLQAAWQERLQRWGWQAQAEVSFSRYGERGRIDLLAWHPPTRTLLVIEIKTEITDVQEVLGRLDVKVRIAPFTAADRGIRPAAVIPALIVRDGTTNRDRIRRIAPLFSPFRLRGRAAVSWLRHPGAAAAASGLLLFSDLRPANGNRTKAPGRHRMRVRSPALSTRGPRGSATRDAEPA